MDIGMDIGMVGVSVDIGLAIEAMVPAGSGGVATSPLSFLVVASSAANFLGEYCVETDSQSGMYMVGTSVSTGKIDLTACATSLSATVFADPPLSSAPAMIPSKCSKSGVSDVRVSTSASFSTSVSSSLPPPWSSLLKPPQCYCMLYPALLSSGSLLSWD